MWTVSTGAFLKPCYFCNCTIFSRHMEAMDILDDSCIWSGLPRLLIKWKWNSQLTITECPCNSESIMFFFAFGGVKTSTSGAIRQRYHVNLVSLRNYPPSVPDCELDCPTSLCFVYSGGILYLLVLTRYSIRLSHQRLHQLWCSRKIEAPYAALSRPSWEPRLSISLSYDIFFLLQPAFDLQLSRDVGVFTPEYTYLVCLEGGRRVSFIIWRPPCYPRDAALRNR